MTVNDHSPRRFATRCGAALAVVAWLTAAACGIWSELSARQRDRLAQQLATRTLAATGAAVPATIARLETLDLSAAQSLITLSASQRTDVAEAAQQSLNRMLVRWEAAATESGDVATLAAQLTTLAAALDAHAGEFGPHGQRWANRLAQRLTVHCDQLPANEAWTILAHCDRVLSRPLLPKPLALPPAEAHLAIEEPVPPQPSPPVAAKEAATPTPPTSMVVVGRPLAEVTLIDAAPPTVAKRLPEQFIANGPRPSSDGKRSPKNRSAKASPILLTSAVVDVPSPQEARLNRRRLRDLSDRQLTAKVADPAPAEATAARQALRDRGFSDAVVELTQRLEAMPPAERRDALERASQLPPADARRLLRWFVADQDPEVRIQALTILATTGDPKLAELARERAVEDADPRVASFAAELMRTR